jgi:predicted ATPase
MSLWKLIAAVLVVFVLSSGVYACNGVAVVQPVVAVQAAPVATLVTPAVATVQFQAVVAQPVVVQPVVAAAVVQPVVVQRVVQQKVIQKVVEPRRQVIRQRTVIRSR